MDPSAQNNLPQDQKNQKPSFIEPGQFVVAGADPSLSGNVQITEETQPIHQLQTSEPAIQNGIQKEIANVLENQSTKIESAPNSLSANRGHPEPLLKLAQDSPPPTPQQPQSRQPDPTPFNVPGQMEQVPHEIMEEKPKKNFLKTGLLTFGIITLLIILGGVGYFFIFKKGSLPISARSSILSDVSQIEDPPAIPKRTTGGFANLPILAAVGATESATPSSLLGP